MIFHNDHVDRILSRGQPPKIATLVRTQAGEIQDVLLGGGLIDWA